MEDWERCMKYTLQIYYGNSETGRVFDGTCILIPTLREVNIK